MNNIKHILQRLNWLLMTICYTIRHYLFFNGRCTTPAIFSILLISFVFSILKVTAQQPLTPPDVVEQQLEAITENNEDIETEDDSFLQSMRQFIKNPVNLNTADISTLKELNIFSPVQIQNIVSYRKLFGNFISIYELQAIPALDIATIEKVRPYITVSVFKNGLASVKERLQGGATSILARLSQVIETQKGFKPPSSAAGNHYPGSRQKLFMRYKYQFKNLLQYGIVGEKDAGEQFFKGAQKSGFDFYSAHLFARNIGIVKSLALGDFTVNLGQGLTQWQSLAFKKSADVTSIKRQLSVLRPYNSAGEMNFHRGAGITIARNNLEATAFISYKNIDANFIADTLNSEDYISSLQTSGYHRTNSEVADKGVQRQFAAGGNLTYHNSGFHIGLNGVQYHFKLPLKKKPDPYNIYSITGNSFGNYSVDYSYGYKNLHFFGEAAITGRADKAFVNGLIISADAKIDMSLLYRNISKSYQSLYSSAFTENTFPNNEKGLYAGISVRPAMRWRVDAYADFYKFPWLKYQVDAPSAGTDYLLQATYKPNKRFEMYVRYKTESKAKNYNLPGTVITGVAPVPRQNIRSHFSYKLNSMLTIRNRIEMVWTGRAGAEMEKGFLTFADCIIKPMMKKYSGGLRLQYFKTGGYNSRLYAYENDVLYSFSIPVFFDNGYRYYLNFNYDVNKKLTVWLRWAQTIYQGKNTIGSGLDEIAGNKRSDIKLQVLYHFGPK